MSTEAEQVASEISIRISQLETFSGESLKGEMQQLKKAIIENPAACLLLKEEDVGQLVAALRKITGIAITEASAKTKKATEPKAKKFTAAELAAALEDEDF